MEESLLKAPRNLNEPVRCKVSAFRKTRAPVAASRTGEETSGVRNATPARRWAAASTSAAVGGAVSPVVADMPESSAASLAEARRHRCGSHRQWGPLLSRDVHIEGVAQWISALP